jgi:hypothetical protein
VSDQPSADSLRLRAIAQRIVETLEQHAPPRAVLLAGSAGEGIADPLSDIDLIAYYEQLPSRPAIRAWRKDVGVLLPGARISARSGWVDTWQMDGVECQGGGLLVVVVEKLLKDLRSGRDPDSPRLQKMAMGLLHGLPLRDDGLIARWHERVREFPEPLARSMAKHHLGVFPFWAVSRQLAQRDARLFEVQSLLDGAFHILGALSAVNSLYFTTFQLKRMRSHISGMPKAPPDLADRLEALFTSPPSVAAAELRQLVSETVDIVAARFPDLDTSDIKRQQARDS